MAITKGTDKQIAWAEEIVAKKDNVSNIETEISDWLSDEDLSSNERAILEKMQNAIAESKDDAVFWIEDQKTRIAKPATDLSRLIEWIVDGNIPTNMKDDINDVFEKRHINFTV